MSGATTRANLTKHGVSFSQAATVLTDPLALTVFDATHSRDEGRLLLASALFMTTPLALGFVDFEGVCKKGKDYHYVSEDGFLEVTARCGGTWTLDGYADASSSYFDGEVNVRSEDGFRRKGAYYGPWEKFRSFTTERDGGDPHSKVNVEVKTHTD